MASKPRTMTRMETHNFQARTLAFSSNRRVVLVSLALLAIACSGTRAAHDYEPSVNFSNLTTFSWMPNQPQGHTKVLHTNALMLERIRKAVNANLSSQGLAEEAEGQGDFFIRALIGADLDRNASHSGHSEANESKTTSSPTPKKISKRHTTESLIIDFMRPSDGSLIWRGTGKKRLRINATPSERNSEVKALVDSILSNYPPKNR
ncbi:MAG: hypothetical protein CL917_17145 [Deltaproteobacteria bacterium]|nr:hypothetical protein [Deltaproteobacteria bacterium]